MAWNTSKCVRMQTFEIYEKWDFRMCDTSCSVERYLKMSERTIEDIAKDWFAGNDFDDAVINESSEDKSRKEEFASGITVSSEMNRPFYG